MSAGTIQIVRNLPHYPTDGTVRRTIVSWVADGNGTVSRPLPLNGCILRATVSPDAINAPNAGWTLALIDEGGIDLFEGKTNRAGTPLSNTHPFTFVPQVPLAKARRRPLLMS